MTRKKSSVPAKAVTADAAVAAVKQEDVKPSIKVVIAAFPGTELKLQAVWAKFIGDYPFKVIPSDDTMMAVASAVADDSVEDNFVFVPANTFPCKHINRGELWLPVVYVSKDGKKTYGHSLPMQFNKAKAVELLTDVDFDEKDPEMFFKKASAAWTPVPVEVGMAFGNFVTPVLRGAPCEHKVIEAMVRKKYITTSAVGWKAIEHLIDQFLLKNE